ncbi:mCG1048414 [Mus musculus]|nr:mCG1048414 [Mus musculus]
MLWDLMDKMSEFKRIKESVVLMNLPVNMYYSQKIWKISYSE